ncbi:hypothetical protein Rsub_06750 [Raphidocelis subcapitata]|uniref:TLC domain-containing protein n=1 Tax=Raphidocelis subcapitata TaxID=307507 RepID=A0A2V0P909_9CHLO|nr:hypothetical protein Rsub_06750 [Raphidocelis subcapitata]|eukprot:GBF93647.1 hypothetical protein Rsub_06750 [Raphidocelis subcapitata]
MAAAVAAAVLGTGHVAALLGLSVFWPTLRWVLHKYTFEPLARRMLKPTSLGPGAKPPPERSPAQQQLLIEKLCESLWKCMVYSAFCALGVAALWDQDWLREGDTRQLWDGWPRHEFSPKMRALYDAELSFYFSSVFMLLFWEVRRKDFAVMFTHHLVTVGLLAASLANSFWRVGCVVMALHDACDVLMEAAKVFNYTDRDAAATASFAGFLVSWAVLRLGALPALVIRSAVRELPDALGGRPPMWWGFCGGLLLLLALHVYWFTLIVRVAWMRVVTGGGRDLREDD